MTILGPLRVRTIDRVISTDDIIPGRYKHMFTDTSELAKHVFENIFPGLAETFRPGDVIYSTTTFGIGSSREQAASSLLAAGVRAVIAPSFGRIFFRNAWNLGLIAVEVAALEAGEGDVLNIDLNAGRIEGPGRSAAFSPPPARMLEMINAGGLLPLVASRLAAKGRVQVGGSVQ
ncbi:LeuD/DmdB family oxidoreductase small subunit [Agrobacterium radiobacter]|uniref:LeuD/DmdB family oxidoreductase small subunit n=1 Tax=Agrobacterium radiobacter TaxID=362 RepID=UPI003F872CBB